MTTLQILLNDRKISKRHRRFCLFMKQHLKAAICGTETQVRATTCGRKEVFAELQEHTCELVSLRDNSKLTIARKGKVVIYQKNGTMTFICDVYYIPNMKSNILSLGQLL